MSEINSTHGEPNKTDWLAVVIYTVAGINLAWGSGEFTLHAFGKDDLVGAWRNAIVAVAAIELLFVWFVRSAKAGKISRAWPLLPLGLTAAIQAAKVSGELTGGDLLLNALRIIVAAASVGAVAAIVYLGELRGVKQDAPSDGEGRSAAIDAAELYRVLKPRIQADLSLLAAPAPAHNVQVNVLAAASAAPTLQVAAIAAPSLQGEANSGATLQGLTDSGSVLQGEVDSGAILADLADGEPDRATDAEGLPVIAAPNSALLVDIEALRGRPVVEAVPLLLAKNWKKAEIARATGRSPHHLSPGRIEKQGVL